jgi:glycine/D-amino acid oxidase-like deaminating enzyme
LRFSAWDYDYLIPRPDGSIVVGGAKSTFFHDSSEWYNNTDDSSLIEPARRYFDNYMQRHFRGWEDTGAYTNRVWTGSASHLNLINFFKADSFNPVMGHSTDSLPHVGHIPNKPGQLVIAGFSGHGMPQIFLSAQAIAQMVVSGATYEETNLPRLFKTTRERLNSKENHILTHAEVA